MECLEEKPLACGWAREVTSIPELPRDRPAKCSVPTDGSWAGVKSVSPSGLPGMCRTGPGPLLGGGSWSPVTGRGPDLCPQPLPAAAARRPCVPALSLSNHRPNFGPHSALVSPSPPTPEITFGLWPLSASREGGPGVWERLCVKRPWQHCYLLLRNSWSPFLTSEFTDLLRKTGNPPQIEEKTHPGEPLPPASRSL